MSSFPLFDLPSFPLQTVLKCMDPTQVVELSFLYIHFKAALRTFQLPAVSIEWCIGGLQEAVIVDFGSTKMGFFVDEYEFESEEDKWNIGGRKVDVQRSTSGKGFDLNPGTDSLKVLESVTDHLFKILKIQKCSCEISGQVDIKNLFIWRFSTNFFNFSIHYFYSKMTPEEMTWMFENLEFHNAILAIRMKNFKYTKKVNTVNIELQCLDWVDKNSLLGMGYSNISIRFAPVNLNSFIKQWMNNQNDALESFYVYDGKISHRKNKIEEGIPMTQSIFQKADYQLRARSTSSDIMDIQRATDNRFATVIFSSSIRQTDFQLLAWHEDKHFKYCCRETKKRFGIPVKP
uniref:FBA_2 domain-containing protein n=1 Tax=Caenorhabditis tropicalis TaxID=1561998 RepID=A0A1I7V227_9PELO